jgi:mannose-6-phosphate isomerase-like protein (cupin superfamily)
MSHEPSYVITPAERRTLLEGPLGAVLLLPSSATSGALTVLEHPLAPRALGSPIHTHQHEDEYSIVLEGTVGVQIGDQQHQAGPGTVVVKPRGIPHTFWNATDQPARLLEIISPAGFEAYFAELGSILGLGGPPDIPALLHLADRYGMTLDPASIPRLVAAHGLELGGAAPAATSHAPAL